MKDKKKIVIVGGVAAGATAAAKARRISPDAQITLLEAGPDISFANCGLPYYIGGDIKSRSKLILESPESFKAKYDVDVFVNTRVVSIDRNTKSVTAKNTQSGVVKQIAYDKLILAQGGRPIKPNLPGADSKHVFSLWTLEDMDKIDSFIKESAPKSAVVVGAGFIGLEMAEALVKRGLKVSVVEMMPHVMAVMDAETAGFIENEMLAYDVKIYTSTCVTDIFDGSVKLDNGALIDADMVQLSVGVRPTLQLAENADLRVGEAGGLLVNEFLQTSDTDIYGAGDMVEIEHRVDSRKVRIPLAGPANRQGRIAAENALGGKHAYCGSIGTSIVRVFDAVAGITGLSLKQARALGLHADAVVVHKEHHTTYYPGAEMVSVLLVYDKETGVILGGQTAGYKGADRRLDVIATATANKLTVSDLADVDFAYSPPLGTANDALNMAAYTAENRISAYSPSVTASELDTYLEGKEAVFIDVRDMFAYNDSHVKDAENIPLELLSQSLESIPREYTIVVYDETGKKGHQALRMLKGAGFGHVVNLSGGYISLQRHERAVGFKNIHLELLPIGEKSLYENMSESKEEEAESAAATVTAEAATTAADFNSPIVVDVRSREEFSYGAYPTAICLPLDELSYGYENALGTNLDRDITLYCASGARSAYAVQYLRQLGYTNVKNGGGLMQMMRK